MDTLKVDADVAIIIPRLREALSLDDSYRSFRRIRTAHTATMIEFPTEKADSFEIDLARLCYLLHLELVEASNRS
jgi:hypothetical protein